MHTSDLKGRKKVAVILTEYRFNSHAEVIVGRLLGRFGYSPSVEVVSMYTDQVPDNDMSRAEAAEFGIPIFPTISEAIAANGKGPIDGVVVIGEHGDYPWNERRQKMYPRRRFMEQVLQALEEQNLHVPVFADKHLAFDFQDAIWIYEEVRRQGIPFMGGSSIPFVPFVPELDASIVQHPKEILVVSFGDTEAYGYHAMEVLQSVAEQRSGGETGILSVSAFEGTEVWGMLERADGAKDLLVQALAAYPSLKAGDPAEKSENPVLFVIEYADGLIGYVVHLEVDMEQWAIVCRNRVGRTYAARLDSDLDRPFRHFDALTHMMEEMILTGKVPFPAERTLVTTGLIDCGMESLFLRRKVSTPELHIRYRRDK